MMLLSNTAGERIDVLLSREIPNLSRSAAQKLCDSGLVTKNGIPVKKNYRTAANDIFSVQLPEPTAIDVQPENIPLDIVFEDDDVIVVNKPKGLVVHPAAGHWSGTLVNALLYHCQDSLSGINGALRPGIVHRIDMDTSGLLIVAKNDFAHQQLAAQLQDHSLARTYECIVCGNIREDSGTINAPIGRHPTDRKRMAVTRQNGRDAITHFTVLARYGSYTHVQCRLETGRTHQIRVHMAYRNHPILGDMVYGHKRPELGMDTQCLHARRLAFVHPRTNQAITLESPLPEYFQAVLHKLGTPMDAGYKGIPTVISHEVTT